MEKIAAGLMVCLAVLSVGAAGAERVTDMPAQARPKAENKMVLLDFTGSDWCGWRIKLNKEVFPSRSSPNTPKQPWSAPDWTS
jgi:protein disulfide-isomerase